MLEIDYRHENKIMKIVNADIAIERKISKLDIMALKAFASSPIQKAIVAARDDLKSISR